MKDYAKPMATYKGDKIERLTILFDNAIVCLSAFGIGVFLGLLLA